MFIVYNITMNNLLESTENYIEPYINLKNLLEFKVNSQSNNNFLTFVRMMAPMLVSDWKMGRHIEVISNKLQDLEKEFRKVSLETVSNPSLSIDDIVNIYCEKYVG